MIVRSTTLIFTLVMGLAALMLGGVAYAQDEPAEVEVPAEVEPVSPPAPTGGYGVGSAWRLKPAKVIMLPTTPPTGEAAFLGDEVMAADIGNWLRERLMVIRGMSVATLHPNSPMIKNSENLSPEDVAVTEGEAPLARAQRAQNVVGELGMDYALVPAITQYKFDATKPEATVTLTIYRAEAEGPPTPIVVAGHSPERPSRRATEATLARAAAADAALRAAAQILEVGVKDLQRWTRIKYGGKHHRRFLLF